MKGWIWGLVQWTLDTLRGGVPVSESAFEQAHVAVEVAEPIPPAEIVVISQETFRSLAMGRFYPRLQAWVENQQSTITIQPQAVFRD